MNVRPHPEDPVPTLHWVYENQPIESGILIQLSRYKRTEGKQTKKVPNRGIQVVVWLYVCINR